jgi:AraC-like DNA-binding protein/quercetin dioxygenase-like cupin family protein
MPGGKSTMATRFTYANSFEDVELPLQLHLFIHAADPEIPLHTHEFSELVIIVGGQGVHITEEGEYPIGVGDVFIITKDYTHGIRDTQGLERMVVKFDPARCLREVEDLKHLPGYHALFILEPRYRKQHKFQSRLHLKAKELDGILQLLFQMEREVLERQPGFATVVHGLFLQLVVTLARDYSRSETATSATLLEMGKVISYIEQHYTEPITLNELAQQANLSVNQFLRVFKTATGHTPIDYLIRLRVLKAGQLLQRNEVSVTQASYQVGFSDSNYFSKQFKRILGKSPQAYRRAIRS